MGRKGLRRLFGPNVVQRLSFIALGRQARFSLEEMADNLTADGGFRVDRQQLRNKANASDKKMRH